MIERECESREGIQLSHDHSLTPFLQFGEEKTVFDVLFLAKPARNCLRSMLRLIAMVALKSVSESSE